MDLTFTEYQFEDGHSAPEEECVIVRFPPKLGISEVSTFDPPRISACFSSETLQ